MKFTLATINLDNNVIAFHEQFGELLEFDMNEYKEGLPKYFSEKFEAMKFEKQIGSVMYFR